MNSEKYSRVGVWARNHLRPTVTATFVALAAVGCVAESDDDVSTEEGHASDGADTESTSAALAASGPVPSCVRSTVNNSGVKHEAQAWNTCSYAVRLHWNIRNCRDIEFSLDTGRNRAFFNLYPCFFESLRTQ